MKFEHTTRSTYIKTDTGDPFRVQLPRMVCSSGMSDYDTISLAVNDKLMHIVDPLITAAKPYAKFPWSDNPSDGNFRVKIDEETHIFDANSELCHSQIVAGSEVICILEAKGVYNFREKSGITYRIHQIKVLGGPTWMGD
jgi:hypothetical protein